MEKLKMHSPNIVDTNIVEIQKHFPNCVTETTDKEGAQRLSIDFEVLKQELSHNIVDGQQERYQLNWPGKRAALLAANSPIAKTIRPYKEESLNFDTTKNLFIEGDNLDALKLLQETYLRKIKMIYIDPPYNTGNDFVYEDDFSENTADFLKRSNQVDESENRLIANTDSNGRFHSDWLSMMYSRLVLSRNLLRDDGIIVISIDDGEYHNLRKLCDEVFGEDNFIDNVIWKKRYGGGAKEKFLVSLHEYALVFAKNITSLNNFHVPLTQKSINRYYTQKDHNYPQRGPFRTHPLEATKSMGERKNLVFPIPGPDGEDILPKRQWLWSKERVDDALKRGELEFIKARDQKYTVHSKQYLKDENGNVRKGKPFSIIDDVYTQHGTNEIIELFGNAQVFPFPKPSAFVKKLIDICTEGGEDEEIILDYFAGSCSTAQAVFSANQEDLGNRRFIMIQLSEACDEKSEAFKAGYSTISDIGKERIRRAGKLILDDYEKGADIKKTEDMFKDSYLNKTKRVDVGFRVLKVDTSNMSNIYYNPDEINQGEVNLFTENIKPDRTSEDLLFQVLLDWGVDLTLPISKNKIKGLEVFKVDTNALFACFAKNKEITEEFCKELAKEKPLRVVFRDAGFSSDAVKINVEQIFKQLSPGTEVRSI